MMKKDTLRTFSGMRMKLDYCMGIFWIIFGTLTIIISLVYNQPGFMLLGIILTAIACGIVLYNHNLLSYFPDKKKK